MAKHTIVAIVEGHGEQHAVPELLRRWFDHRHYHNFDTPDLAVRASGCGALKADHDDEESLGVEHYVDLAMGKRPAGILVLLDSDGECPATLGPALLARARSAAPGVPIAVVIAHREFEAWFLAGWSRLRREGLATTPCGRADHDQPEQVRNPKARVRGLLGGHYSETADQPRLVKGIPFTGAMARRSPSFGKLLRDLQELAVTARAR